MVRYILRGITVPLNLELRSGLNSLGRNPTNDFRIPEASVSSFHCEIEISEAGLLVRDLQSTNGTFLDDQPVTEVRVAPGQVLQLGTITFRVEMESFEIRVPTIEPPPAPKQPVQFADGTFACFRNAAICATHTCVHCQLPFHISSLRGVRLAGGKALLFCPECDGPCEPIPNLPEKKKKSFLGSLTETISMGWRRK